MASRYLADTNILSAGAPNRAEAPSLLSWMEHASDRLYLSAITIAEIEAGIRKLARTGARRRAEELDLWLATVEHLYGDRILPLDAEIARAAGRLSDHASAHGFHPGFADVAIAATAQVHGCILLTRNTRHFAPFEISVLNPYEDQLPEL